MYKKIANPNSPARSTADCPANGAGRRPPSRYPHHLSTTLTSSAGQPSQASPGFQVQYNMNNQGWVFLQQDARVSTSRDFAGMPQADYQIRVRSVTQNGVSAWSPFVKFTIALPKLPGTDNISHNGFIITWDAVPNAVGYKISVKGIRPRAGSPAHGSSM